MPTDVRLPAAFIEHIHDVLVGIFLPFDERVNPAERRDRAAIESALGRPFHTVCGTDVWPTVPEKAAALFHSLICNHCFINGNKRTAVLALDMFLLSQNYFLAMSSEEVYQLAKNTAQANHEGKSLDVHMAELAAKIQASVIDADIIDDPNVKQLLGDDYERVMKHLKRVVRYAITSIESFTKKKFPNREEVDEILSQYP